MDTIIVGGGLAGLTAARDLVSAGCSVLLLEGRKRLGGRAWTEYDGELPTPIELGAEWLGDRGMLNDVLASANVHVREASGDRLRSRRGMLEDGDEFFEMTGRVVDHIKHLPGDDRSLTEVLAETAADPGLSEARGALLAYVKGFHAADPALLSTRWLVEVERHQSATDSQCRTVEGLVRGVDKLRREIDGNCDIRLGVIVREVRWHAGEVEVLAHDGASLRARTAIITVPLPLLGSVHGESLAALQFVPRLPDKERAAGLLRMGHAVKVVLRFRDPFWAEIPGFANLGFLFALGERFPTWWRVGHGTSAVLAGWVGGPDAAALAPAGRDAVINAALESLAGAVGWPVGDVAARLVAQHFHDWTHDPFAMGAYTYVGVGGLDAHVALARHVEGTLFFAGEATCGGGLNATMEGAMQSGARAAAEVLEALRR